MKRLLFLQAIFISSFCFCQQFGVKEKEELAFLSLNSSGFVKHTIKSMPITYVLVDTVDLALQNFIQEKFPKKKWLFFDLAECQEIFKNIGKSMKGGFHLSLGQFNGAYYFDFAFCTFARFFHGDNDTTVGPVIMCGDDFPTGRLRYNEEKQIWEFADQKQLSREYSSIREPDRSRCLPRDDNGLSF
jgi:hypothetical protein